MLTRFAPAPTGLLHLGHVANAIYVWGLAAHGSGEVLLRIEDHDRQRSRPEFEAALLDDLDWLGFAPTHFPTERFRHGPCASRQSDRHAIYEDAAHGLDRRGLLYGCPCSRQDLDRMARTGTGHACRRRSTPLAPGLTWRLRLPATTETFHDRLVGPTTQAIPAEALDPAIRDRAGHWTYQFAVVVDDFLQDIDLVVRGRDLLESTILQIQLGRLIGRPSPATFAHHPLVMKTPTQKLSKSDGDTGIASLRAAGRTAADVIGIAAAAVGLVPAATPIDAHDVGRLFASLPR